MRKKTKYHPYILFSILMTALFAPTRFSSAFKVATFISGRHNFTSRQSPLIPKSASAISASTKILYPFGDHKRIRSSITSTTCQLSSLPSMNSDKDTDEKMTAEYPVEMSDDERYLFDLNGFIIIRNVLTPEEVKIANNIIDKYQNQMIERKLNGRTILCRHQK